MKEVRFRNPRKEHPQVIPMTIAIDGEQITICKMSCHIEWDEDSWGTKIPVVVFRVVK